MKSVLLIGLGRFGKNLAKELISLGHEVMAIDQDENKVNDALSIVTSAQIGDTTNVEFLNSLGVSDYDLCFVMISKDFQSSLETTSLLKELGAKYVISRAERDIQEKFLLRNGADEVIYPEKQVAKWASIRCSSTHILDYVAIDDEHGLYEVTIPEKWIGRTIGQLDIRRKYDINILGIKRNEVLQSSISADTELKGDCTLLVLGTYKSIQKCFPGNF